MQEETKVIGRGASTEADVNLLRAKYPNLVPGMQLKYEEIEEALHIRANSSRFHTVMTRFRRILEEEDSCILKPVYGKRQYIVLDNSGKAQLSVEKAKSAVRNARRAVKIGTMVDTNRLTAEERKRFNHTQVITAAFIGLQSVKPTAELPTV